MISTRRICVQQRHPPRCILLLSHALGAHGGGAPSSVQQSTSISTLTKYAFLVRHTYVRHKGYLRIYMLPGTPYVRDERYVRIHIFIRLLQVNLVPRHTIYTRTFLVRGTRWYEPVSRSRLWQLEHISPPSSTNSNRLRTRAEMKGGASKGPPQTPSGPNSMVSRWRARDKTR